MQLIHPGSDMIAFVRSGIAEHNRTKNGPRVYDDMLTIESGIEGAGEYGYYAAVQRLINRGQWQLNDPTVAAMRSAIAEGRCMLGREEFDYGEDGVKVPSRFDVLPGKPGSRADVANHCGEAWARRMEVL